MEEQASDRAHRIGQTRTVFRYKMVAKDSVEEKIQELQSRKRTLTRDFVRSELEWGSAVEESDLESLFSP